VQGRKAAERLHASLSGIEIAAEPAETSEKIDSGHVRLASKAESEPVHAPKLPGGQRIALGMKEVVETISEDQFLAEIERCYSCGSCFGCEQCYMYCTTGCFTKLDRPRPGRYFTINLDACHECGKCIEVCPCGFLEES
jgi:formate hydrogenlyase subunit 6/NADH:ubiquinone oxidoreductase subunit I